MSLINHTACILSPFPLRHGKRLYVDPQGAAGVVEEEADPVRGVLLRPHHHPHRAELVLLQGHDHDEGGRPQERQAGTSVRHIHTYGMGPSINDVRKIF